MPSVGATDHLSKRTGLYATMAKISNPNGSTQALNGATTAANQDSKGYDFGIRHMF